jgi:hypothetical protein
MRPRLRIALARLAAVLMTGVLLVAWVAFVASPPFGGGIQLAPLFENLAEALYELPSNPAGFLQLVPLLAVLALVVFPPLAIGLYLYTKVILTVLAGHTRA